jgi:regulatory protein
MTETQALEKLRQLCSRQEKCASEVSLLMHRWGIPEEVRLRVISQLIREKFLDEKRYAHAFARDRIGLDHWGRVKVRFVLRQKGITEGALEEALTEIDAGSYRDMVRLEIQKKRKFLRGTPWEIWAKLARYGASRGYEMEVMREFLGPGGPED